MYQIRHLATNNAKEKRNRKHVIISFGCVQDSRNGTLSACQYVQHHLALLTSKHPIAVFTGRVQEGQKTHENTMHTWHAACFYKIGLCQQTNKCLEDW